MHTPVRWEIGSITFRLHPSKSRTIEEACRRPWPDLVAAYRTLTNDRRDSGEIAQIRAVKVVRVAVERTWHEEIRGSRPSVQLLDEYREAVAAAVGDGADTGPDVAAVFRTERELAFAAIEEGLTAEETLSRIYTVFPRTRADRHRVYHYRWLYRQEREGV